MTVGRLSVAVAAVCRHVGYTPFSSMFAVNTNIIAIFKEGVGSIDFRLADASYLTNSLLISCRNSAN